MQLLMRQRYFDRLRRRQSQERQVALMWARVAFVQATPPVHDPQPHCFEHSAATKLGRFPLFVGLLLPRLKLGCRQCGACQRRAPPVPDPAPVQYLARLVHFPRLRQSKPADQHDRDLARRSPPTSDVGRAIGRPARVLTSSTLGCNVLVHRPASNHRGGRRAAHWLIRPWQC